MIWSSGYHKANTSPMLRTFLSKMARTNEEAAAQSELISLVEQNSIHKH